jgi:hypothetical protein
VDLQTVDLPGVPAALDILDQVEGPGGDATNITTADELADVLSDLTGGGGVAATTGGDVINGAAGNDITFGDVLFTDALAANAGLGTDAHSGWSVFEDHLEGTNPTFGVGDDDPAGDGPTWTRDDTIAYIQQNPFQLSGEMPREGGDDTIVAGAGDDLIFAQEGNDQISYALGDGHDFVHGGDGLVIGGVEQVDADSDELFIDLSPALAGTLFFLETVLAYETRTGNDYIFGSDLSTDALNGTDFLTSSINEDDIILFSNVDPNNTAVVGAGHEVFLEIVGVEEITGPGQGHPRLQLRRHHGDDQHRRRDQHHAPWHHRRLHRVRELRVRGRHAGHGSRPVRADQDRRPRGHGQRGHAGHAQ